jgi:hypothetical protein
LQIPNARFQHIACLTRGENAFLDWRAESEHARVDDGADSYVIHDGRIRVQTIHCSLVDKD